jgi:Zn finger protein HypA/HybF involved in hydrogenase expression
VTCCPACKSMFQKIVGSSGMKISVFDITEIILEAIS